MSGISTKRELVKQVYPNKTWASKVDSKSDSEVVAIFLRFVRTGKIKA
jgi:hypothetical protein